MASSSGVRPRRAAVRYDLSSVLNMLDHIDPDDSDIDIESTDDEEEYTPDPGDGAEPADDGSSSDVEEEIHDQDTSKSSSKTSKKPSFEWTKDTFKPPDSTFRGVLFNVPEDYELPSILTFFEDFLTDDMLELLVDMTNQYSVEKNGKSVSVTKKEIEQVIGMFFRMGLAKMPGNRCYWESDTRYEPVAGVMSRNRFMQIISVLHFVDNNSVGEDEKKGDKLWKIRPWLELFRRNCLGVIPEEQNSIDEMMIPFKGKFSKLKQYVKGKPHPWGIKVWARTSNTGILCDFEVYEGNKGQREKSPLGVGADVVLKLCESLPQNIPGQPPHNYKVTADNFFTGIPLVIKLKEIGIHYTGTVRPNRLPGVKLKSENDMKKKGRGAMDQSVEKDTNIVAVRWYDTRGVTTLSTYLGINPTNSARRYDKTQKTHIMVQRPDVIKVYNENMGGVDLLDCFCAKHTYRMKSKRWYLYIFWHFLRIMLVNAWLSYRRVCSLLGVPKREVLNQRKFQARIATLLIEMNAVKKRGRPSLEEAASTPNPKKRTPQSNPVPEVVADGYFHFMTKSDQRKRCKKCSLKCNNVCQKCQVYLCYTEQRNCFLDFHVN